MKKKYFHKPSEYFVLIGGAMILMIIMILAAIVYVRNVRTDLWDSSVQTVIMNTDQAGEMISSKIDSQWYSIENQAGTFRNEPSSDTEMISYLVDEFNTKEYPIVLVVGDKVYPDKEDLASDSYTVNEMSGQKIIPPYISQINGKRVIALTCPVTFQDGVNGRLIKEISVNELNEAFSVSVYQNHGHSYLVDKSGKILFRSTNAKGNKTSSNLFDVLNSEPENDSDVIKKAEDSVAAGYSGWFTSNYNGETNLYYYTPVQETEWCLVTVIATVHITEQTQNILHWTLLLVGIIVLFFIIMISLVIYKESKDLKRVKDENVIEKQLIVASNSETRLLTLAIDPDQDSYRSISADNGNPFTIPDCSSYSELMNYFDAHIDEDYKEEFQKVFSTENLKNIIEGEKENAYRECIADINGERHWLGIEANLVHLKNQKGLIVFSIRQIDAAKQEEEERRKVLQNARIMAEKANNTKTAFLSNISHDIRTPLNAIVGMTNLMEHDKNDPDKVEGYIQKMQSSSRHLLGLINDVLDMSKIEAGEVHLNRGTFSLAEQIQQIDSIIRPQTKEKNQKFIISTEGIIHEYLIGDDVRLRQIFINLLSNSVKYTQSGGTIMLKLKEVASEKEGTAKFCITVSDNGYGMTDEYQQHIFEPFTREEDSMTNKVQGTGLGMAITKNIVDMKGGSISVKSEVGKGSTFEIVIPLEINKDVEYVVDTKKVLLISDDAAFADNVQTSLQKAPVQFRKEATIEDALDHLQTIEPDVILVNVCEYSVKDTDSVKALRDKAKENTLILCCGFIASEKEKDDFMQSGMDGVIAYPFFFEDFATVVNRLRSDREKRNTDKTSDLSGKRFLCAEDNELNSEILTALLEMENAACKIYPNGAELVKAFENVKEGEYDAILMDMQMPVMNGLDATRAIRNGRNPFGRTIPIIAMTANAFSNDVQACLDAGMDAHLSKPLDIAAMERTIRSLCNRKFVGGADNQMG